MLRINLEMHLFVFAIGLLLAPSNCLTQCRHDDLECEAGTCLEVMHFSTNTKVEFCHTLIVADRDNCKGIGKKQVCLELKTNDNQKSSGYLAQDLNLSSTLDDSYCNNGKGCKNDKNGDKCVKSEQKFSDFNFGSHRIIDKDHEEILFLCVPSEIIYGDREEEPKPGSSTTEVIFLEESESEEHLNTDGTGKKGKDRRPTGGNEANKKSSNVSYNVFLVVLISLVLVTFVNILITYNFFNNYSFKDFKSLSLKDFF